MGKKEKVAVKVVLDTNVLISSLLFKGELAGVVDLWKNGKIIPIFSRDTFDEFKSVLEYPQFSLTTEEMKAIIEEEVLPFFEVIEVTDKIKRVRRDADDDKFITCAVSASADFIVTGYKDLLDIGRYKSVRILSASEFSRMFKI